MSISSWVGYFDAALASTLIFMAIHMVGITVVPSTYTCKRTHHTMVEDILVIIVMSIMLHAIMFQ